MSTSGATVTVINPPVTSMVVSLPGGETTSMVGGGNSGSRGRSSCSLATATLETNAKLDRIFHMVTASQATIQQSIEALRVEFRKEQEETAERAAKKARLSAEVTFRKKGNERQFRFNESLQENLRVAYVRLEDGLRAPAGLSLLSPCVVRAPASTTCNRGRYASVETSSEGY